MAEPGHQAFLKYFGLILYRDCNHQALRTHPDLPGQVLTRRKNVCSFDRGCLQSVTGRREESREFSKTSALSSGVAFSAFCGLSSFIIFSPFRQVWQAYTPKATQFFPFMGIVSRQSEQSTVLLLVSLFRLYFLASAAVFFYFITPPHSSPRPPKE
jgi:hypothetical protein